MIKFRITSKLLLASKIILLSAITATGLSCSGQFLFAQKKSPDKEAKSSTEKAAKETEKEKLEAEIEEATDELPLFETLTLPGIDQLLKGEKEDWIVLIGGRVLKVPALQPRPDLLAWLLEQQKKLLASRPSPAAQEKNANLLPEWLEKYKEFNSISITYSEKASEDDYRLPVRYVDYILYHEDLALRKADELIRQGNSVDAQRLISAVGRWSFQNNIRRKKENLAPIQWPGLVEAQRKLLQLNFKQAQAAGNWERAFNLVKIHRGFDPQFDQIPRLLGSSFSTIAEQAMKENDYRKIRFYLRELQKMVPTHSQIKNWQARLKQLSQEKTELGTAEFQKKNYRSATKLAHQAVQIWPYNSQHRRELSRLQERYQILRVGQINNSRQLEFQHRCLLNHQWFYVEKITEGYPRFRSRFIETWTPSDLGRTIQLQMKSTRPSYESQPELKSFQLARNLEAVSLACSSQQRGLYANSIESIYTNSPDQLEIQLASQPPHPLGLFAGLLNADSASQPTTLANTFFRQREISSPEEKSLSLFVRAFPEPDNASRFGVAEVQERTFFDKRSLLRALLRDELDYVPNLPLAYVKRLNRDQRFFVLKYHTPQVTLLQFHFHGLLAKEPALRLALLAALDRNKMKEQFAQTEGFQPAELRLTKSIAPSNSHAKNQSGKIVKYDRIAARALYIILTRSQKKKIPDIKLLVSQEPGTIRLAEFIKLQWESMGLKVSFVTRDKKKGDTATAPSASWDVAIVSHRMLAPQHDLPRLLSENGKLTETELQKLPLPLQRSLLELEQARNWSEIDKSLRQLQDRLVLDAWMLPLWEQEVYQAIRREIRGAPPRPLKPYQNLDRWMIEPVIPAY